MLQLRGSFARVSWASVWLQERSHAYKRRRDSTQLYADILDILVSEAYIQSFLLFLIEFPPIHYLLYVRA